MASLRAMQTMQTQMAAQVTQLIAGLLGSLDGDRSSKLKGPSRREDMVRIGSSGRCIGTQPQVSELLGTSVSNTAITLSDTRSTQPSRGVPLSLRGLSEQLILGGLHVSSMSQEYGGPVVISAPSQRSIQASGLSQASSLYSEGSQYNSKEAVPWGEPLYRNEAMPSLERSDS